MISYEVLEKRNTARRKPEVWIYSAFLPGVPSMRLVVLTFQQQWIHKEDEEFPLKRK